MQNLRKSDLPRCMSCQNPHNHQVAAVFGFAVRLASHLFLEILLPVVYFRLPRLDVCQNAQGAVFFFDCHTVLGDSVII